MARNKNRGRNGNRTSMSFVMFQHRMLQHPAFCALSANACKVLLFLASQFKGSNNGDLAIAWKLAKDKGFRSNGALRLATKELTDAGFLIQTRRGGRNQCSLFALSWFPINECEGKLDVPATTVAPNDWLWNAKKSEPYTVQCEPVAVQSGENGPENLSH